MVCNQTGKILQTSLHNLSKENGESLDIEDLFDGNTVLYEASDKKTYDVTIKGINLHITNNGPMAILN